MTHLGRLEITTHMGCSINCRYCPQSLLLERYYESDKQRVGMLSFENFKNCLNKLPVGTRIDFSGMAEPWLNPSCTDMVIYASEQGFPIAIYTTLVGMSENDFQRIKNIKMEEFVLHIPDNKNNSHIPITDDYRKLLKLVVETTKNGVPLVTGYSCHAEVHPLVQDIIPQNSKLNSEMIDRAGNLDDEQLKRKENMGGIVCVNCGTELNHNVLLPDGTVLLCCMDYGMEHVLGNLIMDDYEQIMMSAETIRVKDGLAGNRKDVLCRRCTNGRDRESLFNDFYLFREWCRDAQRKNAELQTYALAVNNLQKRANDLMVELQVRQGEIEKQKSEKNNLMEKLCIAQNRIEEQLQEQEILNKSIEGLQKERVHLNARIEEMQNWKGYSLIEKINKTNTNQN